MGLGAVGWGSERIVVLAVAHSVHECFICTQRYFFLKLKNTCFLFTVDAAGNVCAAGAAVTASLSGPADVEVEVADNGDGTYSASYVPEVVGAYTLAVQVNGAELSHSPFSVAVTPAAADASQCEASGPGLSGASTDAPGKFVVQARDAFGNACDAGGRKFVVALSGAPTCKARARITRTARTRANTLRLRPARTS